MLFCADVYYGMCRDSFPSETEYSTGKCRTGLDLVHKDLMGWASFIMFCFFQVLLQPNTTFFIEIKPGS